MKNSKDNKSVAVIEKSDKKENYMLPIEEESLRLLQITEETRDKMEEYYIRILEDDEAEAEAEDKTNSLRRAAVNITKALTQTYAVTDELSSRWNDIKKQKKKKFIAPAPANAAIDLKEEKSEHFAKGQHVWFRHVARAGMDQLQLYDSRWPGSVRLSGTRPEDC